MPVYVIEKPDGSISEIEADFIEQDGSALRLYRGNDDTLRMVAAYRDGQYKSCEPKTAAEAVSVRRYSSDCKEQD